MKRIITILEIMTIKTKISKLPYLILIIFTISINAQDMIVSGDVSDPVDGTYLDTGEYDNTRYYKKQAENLYLFRRTIPDGDSPGGYWFIGPTLGQITGNIYGRVYNQFSNPNFPLDSPNGETLNKNGINELVPYPRTIAADAPTPVGLISFTAIVLSNSVDLRWETATEVNNYGFEIERHKSDLNSQNLEWSKIGFIEGHGNSNSPKLYSFTDNPIGGSLFKYRLKQINIDGTFTYSEVLEVKFTEENYELSQNYPNPFNPMTTIKYSIANVETGYIPSVQLKVYDILGSEIITLVNKEQAQGNYEIDFDGSELSSGIYFYRLQVYTPGRAGDFVETKKMILLK